MRPRLRQDLTRALKAGDQVAVAALRSAIAAIDNAEAVDTESLSRPQANSAHVAGATAGAGASDVERRRLSDGEQCAIIRAQVEERWQAADDYEELGRDDQAARLRREADILRGYL